jgi:magnesium transporter
MISILHWDAAAKACGPKTTDKLPATAAEVAADDVWWVDLTDPTPDEEERVFGQFFPVHALTREDITRPRNDPDQGSHLPKVEEFPDYLFVIVNPLPPGLAEVMKTTPMQKEVRPPPASVLLTRKNRPQLSAVLNERVLVTHHYQPLECVTDARTFLDRHLESARRGPDFIFHHVLDAMVDEYAPVVDRIASRLDRLEIRIFKNPTQKLLAHLLRLKRMVTGLRKTLILEREVLARLIRGEFELVEEREVVYYRNVYDHLVRYTELVESAREMVSDLMEIHLSAVSNRLNQVVKVLTMISTIVLPMTLVAGIYGMNFKHMPELNWEYGYPMALGIMALLAVGSLAFFRWKKWL